MRYEIKSLSDLDEFIGEIGDQDRISIHCEGKRYVFRIFNNKFDYVTIEDEKK